MSRPANRALILFFSPLTGALIFSFDAAINAALASSSMGAVAFRCRAQSPRSHSSHRVPRQVFRISVVMEIISSVSRRMTFVCSRVRPARSDACSTSCSAFTAQDRLLDNTISLDFISESVPSLKSFPSRPPAVRTSRSFGQGDPSRFSGERDPRLRCRRLRPSPFAAFTQW